MADRPTGGLLLACLVHSSLGMSAYYYFSCINVPQELLQTFVNQSVYQHYDISLTGSQLRWLWSLTACSLIVGSIIGSMLLNHMVERFGSRDKSMVFHNLFMIAAGSAQMLAFPLNCFELLILGRLLAGLSVTIAYWTGVYLTECSPLKVSDFCCYGTLAETVV